MPDKIIELRVTLNCPVENAFGYFTDNSLLETWLTSKADVEAKTGGKYELFWTPDDPDYSNNSTYGCKVLAIERPHYLNIEWKGNAEQKHFMNNVRPLTNVTIIFTALPDSKTKVTLLHTGWRTGEDWENARQYFVKAWGHALNALSDIVNK